MNASISISAPVLKPLRTVGSALASSVRTVIKNERALSIAGLMVAPVLIASFYFVLIGHQSRIRQMRDTAQLLAQEQHQCNIQPSRQTRERCSLDLLRP